MEPTPPPQQTLPIVKKEGTNKILLITIGVLLLGFGLLAGYMIAILPQISSPQITPTPAPTSSPTVEPTIDPTATWKTYQSSNAVYSIKYPSETFIRYICPNEELTLVVRKSETEESVNMPTCARGGRYDIEIVTLTQSFTEPQSSTNYSVTKTATIVGGLPATRYITKLIQQPASGDIAIPYSHDVYVTKNGKTYLLHLGSEDLQSTFDDMLATFKFLN